VGSRVGLDVVVRKIPSPYRDSKPRIVQPVAQRYTAELARLPIACVVKIIFHF
jgi:hypothetical protein